MGGKLSRTSGVRNTTRRICEKIKAPISHKLRTSELFGEDDSPDVIRLKEHLIGEGRLDEECALKIIHMATRLFKLEENLLHLNSPVNLVGDIHGQFYDLLTVFTLGGSPDSFKYLFLGDFVDRGMFSFECVCFLFSLKIKYPKSVFLLRGNHESRHLTTFFTFKEECLLKANQFVYEKCMQAFDALPVAALLDNKFFCVHGGLSPHFTHLKDVNAINRFQELPKKGLLCDLLWSDPVDIFDELDEKNVSHDQISINSSTPSMQSANHNYQRLKKSLYSKKSDYFNFNSSRGCSFNYSQLALAKFLEENNLLCLIRAHQVQREGIRLYSSVKREPSDDTKTVEFPSMISLFSAPNYCDVYQNKAAIIQCVGAQLNVKLFTAAEHPFVLPNFQDAFSWSLPFIYEKLTEFLIILMNLLSDKREAEELTRNDLNRIGKFVKFRNAEKAKLKKKEKEKEKSELSVVSKYHEAYRRESQLSKSELNLGSLSPSSRVRRRSSDADRELLSKFEQKGIMSFEDANNLDSLQYKIINSDEEGKQ